MQFPSPPPPTRPLTKAPSAPQLLEVDYDTPGVMRNGNELQLTNVTRHQSGSYTCHAVNEIGLGESQPIVLNVMCEYGRWGDTDFSPVLSECDRETWYVPNIS